MKSRCNREGTERALPRSGWSSKRPGRAVHDPGGTMSIRKAIVTMAIALLAAGLAGDALAQQRSEGPCARDVKQFCCDGKQGEGGGANGMSVCEYERST